MDMCRTLGLIALAAATALTGCNHHHGSTVGTPSSLPTPEPSAAPAKALGCTLPPGTGPGDSCPFDYVKFMAQVEQALDMTIVQHPEIFDLNDGGPCGNCYQILNPDAYNRYVVENLEAQGLCAIAGEEFGVKNSNDFNEQYDLMTSSNHIRRQGGAYRGTCRPADF
jgi:hypothetical protein